MEIKYLDLSRITAMHGEEYASVATEVIRSGRYLRGSRLRAFEKDFAMYVEQAHCVGCGSGLDALTLMLRAYKELGVLKDGDEVLVSAHTFIATILSITENGLTPILVDAGDNFQIDDTLIEASISPRTRALLTVHLYGYNSLTPKILDLCRANHLLLLQDCAQAHGLNKMETLPDTSGIRGACAYSFYPGKNMGAMADAGAVTTDDDELAEVVRALVNYGGRERNVYEYKGRNSRMDELTAALLSVKLKYLDEDNRRRREFAKEYVEKIRNEKVTLPKCEGVHHIFPILCKERDTLKAYLAERGVETLVHYPIPPHRQECYKEWKDVSLPNTEKFHREELSLPLNQAMTREEVEYVIDCVNAFV